MIYFRIWARVSYFNDRFNFVPSLMAFVDITEKNMSKARRIDFE